MQTLLTIASVITAITVIAVFLKKIYKTVRNIEINFTDIKSDLSSNILATLRLVVMSSDMPLDERVNARQGILCQRWKRLCTRHIRGARRAI